MNVGTSPVYSVHAYKELDLSELSVSEVLICAPDSFVPSVIQNLSHPVCSTVRNVGVTCDQALEKRISCLLQIHLHSITCLKQLVSQREMLCMPLFPHFSA